jgi:MoaA/NifB/PqqE/SkfB family radical SAM enzyme
MDKGLMNQKAMFKIIDEVAPYVDSIGLTGLGEPLIYKKLQEALLYVKSKNKGIQTSVSTNAHIPMTNEYLSKIIPHLDQIQISIDGIGEVYEKVRQKGNYEFFLKNLQKIKDVCDKHNVSMLFNFTIVEENFRQMPEILDLANEYGVQYVNLNPNKCSSRYHFKQRIL